MDRAADPHDARSRAGDRQYRLHLDPRQQAARIAAEARPAHWPADGNVHPVGLLFSLAWVIRLTGPLFVALAEDISGPALILLVRGLFLIFQSTTEIHHRLEGEQGSGSRRVQATFGAVVVQIALLDIVFS